MIDINEMTVLIADDMPNMITTLRNMMKVLKYGKRFIPANNGEQAWRILKKEKEEPVELAILDSNMPVMTGAELLSRIREDRDLRDLPVVMVTALANREFVAEAAESETDAYILKPPTVKVLGEKILGVIENANNPSPMVTHLKEARRFEEAGDIDAAIQKAHLAVDANPLSSKPVHELGYYYLKKGDPKEAEQWLLKAVEMNPLDVAAFDHLGKLYVKLNDIETASRYFEKAVSINPRDVTRAVYFGIILLGRKMVQEAVRVFEKVLDVAEDDLRLKEQIAGFCIEKEAKEYGARLLESILGSRPDRKDLFFKLGVILEELGQHSKALNYLASAEKEDGKNLDIKIHLARVYLAMGKAIRAEKPLRQILEADPDNKEAMKLLRQGAQVEG
jgi:tetratricopeptide (TPR) repeat protein